MLSTFLSKLVRRLYRDPIRRLRYALGLWKANRADVSAEENFGRALFLLAKIPQFLNYVEIGTAHGLGSTAIIMNGLAQREDSSQFWSLEAMPSSYRAACKNLKKIAGRERLHLLHGVIVRGDEVMTWAQVESHPNFERMQDYCFKKYQTYKNICNEMPYRLDDIPDKIDVLVLDGGEFSSFAEFNKLQSRTQLVVLDETHTAIKNFYVREMLEKSLDWHLLCVSSRERFGWCAFVREERLDIVSSIFIDNDRWKSG